MDDLPVSVLPQRNLWDLTRSILSLANRGVPRQDFLRRVGRLVLDFSGCDLVEFRLWGTPPSYRYEFAADNRARFELLPDDAACRFAGNPGLERVCAWVTSGEHPAGPNFTGDGGFFSGDCTQPLALGANLTLEPLSPAGGFASLAVLGFSVAEPGAPDARASGLVLLWCRGKDRFSRPLVESFQAVAQTTGIAVADRRAQWALRERVKELTCLYGISQLVEQPDLSTDELFQGIVELLPPAVQYPELASAELSLDGRAYRSSNWRVPQRSLSAPILSGGRPRGSVSVGYPTVSPELEPDLFLPEEQALVDGVAGQVGLAVERRAAVEERHRLEEQLRHADRLATIGQLAAGVAHELNEPLGSILGFAQLAGRDEKLPAQTRRDLDRIVAAALHAREVIQKLMFFARQLPPRTTGVDLNELIRDGLYFLEARCRRSGIELVRAPDPQLPEVVADPSQLLQVLVNLVVNAIQAMPKGGRLTIATAHDRESVSLSVEDTGVGMSAETIEQIFLPFFTTKDHSEGTGLGLPVAHGIVTAHGGTISVESKVGIGSRFSVRLPLEPGPKEQG